MHMHIHLRVRNLNALLSNSSLICSFILHLVFQNSSVFTQHEVQDHGAVTQLIHENLRFFPLQKFRILLDQFPEDLFCQEQIGFIGNSDLDLQPSFSIAVTFVILSFVSTEFGITIRRLSMVISVV